MQIDKEMGIIGQRERAGPPTYVHIYLHYSPLYKLRLALDGLSWAV